MFSRTDTVTDSERFYNSILELLEDPKERQEVDDLLTWWNRYVAVVIVILSANLFHYSQIFPGFSSAQREVPEGSALARIREKRAALEMAEAAESL